MLDYKCKDNELDDHHSADTGFDSRTVPVLSISVEVVIWVLIENTSDVEESEEREAEHGEGVAQQDSPEVV